MPRIRITGLPKMALGGTPPDCDEGYVPSEDGTTCVLDSAKWDIHGCLIGKERWSDADQMCIPISSGYDPTQYDQKNRPVGTGKNEAGETVGGLASTGKTGPGTGVNPGANPSRYSLDYENENKKINRLQKTGKNILGTAVVAQPVIDYFTDRKQQKRFNKWWSESKLMDNALSPESTKLKRGDYFELTGQLRPDQLGFRSKGMYTNPIMQPSNVVKYGGSPNTRNMKTIRIRIIDDGLNQMNFGGINPANDMSQVEEYFKQLEQFRPKDPNANLKTNILNAYDQLKNINKPGFGMFDEYYKERYGYNKKPEQPGNKQTFFATGGQPMTYSGQLGYGLNLGQKRIYTDMPPEKSETLSKTLKPVPRSKANIEAEKNETILGDIDGDGAMEHMEIGGKRHTQGGTPLNVPEGSFIFSDTAKLRIKDEKILKMFGMPPNKKGYTPAEIAKKYDINKYKAIIEDKNADEIKKATAQLMVKTYQKKLAQLALIQEQMKGFPQGIPDVVKNIMPELAQVEGPAQEVPTQEDNKRAPMAPAQPGMRKGGSVSNLGMYDDGGTTLATTLPPTGSYYDQTVTPKTKASLKDKDYARLQELLKTKASLINGEYVVKSLSDEDAAELASLITKFGLQHDDEEGIAGYKVMQSGTPDYSWSAGGDKKIGFFAGVTPKMFENKVLNSLYTPEQLKPMNEVQRRRIFLANIGITHGNYTDAQLKDVKKLYTDPEFFNKVFYPAFIKTFEGTSYRPEQGDDAQIGLEHLDQFKWQAPPRITKNSPKTYVCTEQGPVLYSETLHKGLTQYNSYAEAQQVCYKGPGDFNGKNMRMPFQYMPPDLVAMAAAAATPPRKYLPWSPQLPYMNSDLLLEDVAARAYQRQSQTNKMAEMLGTYGPSSGFGANLANLQANQAEALVSDIAEVNARNVAIANQFAQNEAQRKDRNVAANIGRAQELWDKNVIANQNYDNAKRAYLNTNAKAFGNAWKNRMYLSMLNNVNQMYPVNPLTGEALFNQGAGQGWDDFGGRSGAPTAQDYYKLKEKFMEDGWPDNIAEEKAKDAIKQFETKDKDAERRSILQYYLPERFES